MGEDDDRCADRYGDGYIVGIRSGLAHWNRYLDVKGIQAFRQLCFYAWMH